MIPFVREGGSQKSLYRYDTKKILFIRCTEHIADIKYNRSKQPFED